GGGLRTTPIRGRGRVPAALVQDRGDDRGRGAGVGVGGDGHGSRAHLAVERPRWLAGSAGRVGVVGMSADQIERDARAWVERTCREQDRPVKVTDPAVLARAAALAGAQTRQKGSTRRESNELRPLTAGEMTARSRTPATIA